MKGRLLFVDDEVMKRRALGLEARRRGFEAEEAAHAREGLDRIQASWFDVVVTDVRMPGMDGHEFLRRIREIAPGTSVVIMTAYGTVENAVQAMRDGAQDYLLKPFTADELFVKLERILEFRNVSALNEAILAGAAEDGAFHGLVGCSTSMRALFSSIARVARTPSTVLVTGESGTGKELVAEALHALSTRAQGPLVKVSCATLAQDLIESELFGHVRGAFTGAVRGRRGRFEIAAQGTLLLDDVDDIPPAVQVKLLRVLQEREVEPVGGESPISVDARLIAATKVDLHGLVREGRFREDLFYRLNVLPIRIPPLRERVDDIPRLARHFLKKFEERLGRKMRGFDEAALAALRAHPWPGNVRELEHAIERGVSLAAGDLIGLVDLPEALHSSAQLAAHYPPRLEGRTRIDLREELAAVERRMLMWALDRAGDRQGRAAELLGIPRTTLRDRLTRYGLATPPSDDISSGSDEMSSDR